MPGLSRLNVLVVDDNRHVRILVKEILAAADATVEEAEGGAAALRACLANPPDLVIVDYEMPGMSGADFTRALRAKPEGAAVAVLLMTGHGDQRRVLEASRAGVDGVVAKPLAPQALFTRIEAALRKRAEAVRP